MIILWHIRANGVLTALLTPPPFFSFSCVSISACTVNAEFDRIIQAELRQNNKASYTKLLSLCFHARALASQTSESDAQTQLVSLIRQLGFTANIILGQEISNITASPIVSAMVEWILQLTDLGVMDLLDEIDTVPATPGIIVEILVSGFIKPPSCPDTTVRPSTISFDYNATPCSSTTDS